jgi:hypothetical protein
MDPGKPPVRMAFLVLSWLLLFLGFGIVVAVMILKRDLSRAAGAAGVLAFLLGITGLIVRRIAPGSRAAGILPTTVRGQELERKVSRAELIYAAAVVLALLVAAWWSVRK